MSMNAWTFSRKVSASIAAAALIVVMVTSGFVYVTFTQWTECQEAATARAIRAIRLRIGDVGFLPSLLQPERWAAVMQETCFKPDLSLLLAAASMRQQGRALKMVSPARAGGESAKCWPEVGKPNCPRKTCHGVDEIWTCLDTAP